MAEGNRVVGYSWVVFCVVLCGQSVALGFGLTCIPPFLTTIAVELNLSSTQVDLAWGMIGLALMFSLLGGLISDRIGLRKPALLVACVVGGIANLIQGSFLGPALIVILVIMPFGVGTISPLLFTMPFELKGLHQVSQEPP